MSWCWRHPWLTGLEVLWRWAYGIPALILIRFEVSRVVQTTQVDEAALGRMTVLDPMAAAETLTRAGDALLPAVVKIAVWMVPVLVIAWIFIASVGRRMVLRRLDASLNTSIFTLIALQVLRTATFLGCFAAWLWAMRLIALYAIKGPVAAGQEPDLVVFSAMAIVTTLAMFTLWAVASWVLQIGPLVAMLRGTGAGASLVAACRLGPLRSKLMEINLVMGIVKIALIVLAMVFSATPLPFESVATPEFMAWWYAGVAILYLVTSDFFHVTRTVAYFSLWQEYFPKVENLPAA